MSRIVTKKPLAPSLRHQQHIVDRGLDKTRPSKKFLSPIKKKGGRNVYGRVTVAGRGGGAKRMYRKVDFDFSEKGIPGKVVSFEYDPNRNVEIALVVYENGAKHYVLKFEGMEKECKIIASEEAEVSAGNSLPLEKIPLGFFVYNVEFEPGKGAAIAKSAGSSVQLISKDNGFAMLRMPSSEVRLVSLNCWASVGKVANADHINMSLGKAGRSRHLGFRPKVRGMAMNPVDHKRGGGEGRSKSGTHPVSASGKVCSGRRTRNKSSKMIIKRRKR